MADDLVAKPKHISERIVWRPHSQHPGAFGFDVAVTSDQLSEPLRLIGYYGRTNWSIVLLTRSGIPLRRLTVHPEGHKNPDGTIAGSWHKHIWDEVNEDRWTYVPPEIDFEDINEGLIGFLTACNIECRVPPERIQARPRTSL
jgi:hypothetical protein